MTFDQASAAHIDGLAHVRAQCLRTIYKIIEPVAAPTSGDMVVPARQTLSSPSGNVAAAGDSTASNSKIHERN